MQNIRKTIWIIIILVLLATLNACSDREEQETPEIINQGSMTDIAPEETFPALPPVEVTEAVSVTPTAEPIPIETPQPRIERVTDDYFSDAAFFGNSLVDGLHSFGKLEHGDFFAGTSASVLSVTTIRDTHLSDGTPATLLDALLEKQYAHIYVLLGINELGFNTQSFVELYADLLETISTAEPDAEIFIMSLTPITERRNNSADIFTREKIDEFNNAIHTMADEYGYVYLDLYSELADESGWLPPEKSTDGVHFTADEYTVWAEFLRTNYDGNAPKKESGNFSTADEEPTAS